MNTEKPKEIQRQGDRCPINGVPCTAGDCMFYTELDDFEGCSLRLAAAGIKHLYEEKIRPAAKLADVALAVGRFLLAKS